MRVIGRGQRGDGEGHRTATCPRLPSLRQGTWGTASWERRSPKLFPSLERAASAQGDSPQGQIAALGSQWRRTPQAQAAGLPAAAPAEGDRARGSLTSHPAGLLRVSETDPCPASHPAL